MGLGTVWLREARGRELGSRRAHIQVAKWLGILDVCVFAKLATFQHRTVVLTQLWPGSRFHRDTLDLGVFLDCGPEGL